ncbi:MAG: hypothetical protein AAGF92_15615 [Myxococcota bacterium]
MRSATLWALTLALWLSSAGCDGNDGPPIGVGGVGGATSEICATICLSPCASEVNGFPSGGLDDCLDECADTPVYEVCAFATTRFIRCIDAAGCGEAAQEQCQAEAINFGQCLTQPGAEF